MDEIFLFIERKGLVIYGQEFSFQDSAEDLLSCFIMRKL